MNELPDLPPFGAAFISILGRWMAGISGSVFPFGSLRSRPRPPNHMFPNAGKKKPAPTKKLLLKDLHRKWAQCRLCPELKSHIQFPVTCHGNLSSAVMLVSDGAYIKSIQESRSFNRGFLRDALPNLQDCRHLTDVITFAECTAAKRSPSIR